MPVNTTASIGQNIARNAVCRSLPLTQISLGYRLVKPQTILELHAPGVVATLNLHPRWVWYNVGNSSLCYVTNNKEEVHQIEKE